MNISNLKYVKEIARTRSITRAAENLGIGQPRLSKTIRELENSIGFTIFERSVKGVIPTTKGAVFLTHADNILGQLKMISDLSRSNKGRDRFSVSMPRGSYIAEGFIKFVSETGSKERVSFDVYETNSMETINSVADKRFNLGIIRYQNRYEKYFLDYLAEKKLKTDLIWEFECLVLMSKQHPLAQSKKINPSDLSQFIEIVHGDNIIPYLNIQASDLFEAEGDNEKTVAAKKIYIYDRGVQFSLLNSFPVTYIWVSPVPDNILDSFNLVQRKCSYTENRFRDLLAFRKGYKLSELDKIFIPFSGRIPRNSAALLLYRGKRPGNIIASSRNIIPRCLQWGILSTT
jgi:DNA-binding transcriptional LysR family regulator